MRSLFHEKTSKGSVTVHPDCVEYKNLFLRVAIPFHSVESIRVVNIPWWVSARGVSTLFPFRRKVYIVIGGHTAFKPGKGLLFRKSEGFWDEMVVVVTRLEEFMDSVQRASGRPAERG